MRKKILMTICFLAAIGLSLGAGVQAGAQERLYDVDLSMSGATVSSFTAALTGQTGVLFSYETDLAAKSLGNISIKQNQASLESILTRAFSGKGITWKVVNRTVVLTAEQAVSDARKLVRGTVKDASGEPLIAAGVLVKGKSYGVTTDVAGNYAIEVAQGETLVYSFLGYETKEVKVGTSSTINVVLEDDSTLLDDVVVVGYGTQSRKTLSTSISKVDGEKLMDAPVSTVGDALKGKVTGLRVASNNNLPGESPRFLIRGGSSINRSNDPLFLVDGVERGIDDLNPNDIESIEVLKDAASAAIYGSRASNGVILVTTKKGNAFKQPQVVFDAQVGFTSPARTWKLANATEFLTIIRPAAEMGPNAPLVLNGANGAGIGNTEATSTYSTRYLQEGETVPAGYLSMADPIDPSKTIIYTDHDWQSEWYHPSLYHKEYVGINGGNKNMGAVMEHDCLAAKDGGLTKRGNGKLLISATPTFTGDVKVEAGTLDMSGTSFALGADAVIGGGGTLIPPSGGLTVTGAFTLDPTNAPTLTVSGPVTIGAGATITVTDPSLLDKKTSYRFYTATATSGTPELVGFPRGWMAMNDGVSLRVLYASGTTILFR